MKQETCNRHTMNEIQIQNERLLLIEDTIGWDQMRKLAFEHKVKAMGMFSQLLFRPKTEDVSIVYEEKRYQSFWHVVGSCTSEYRRTARYQVPVDSTVLRVVFKEDTYEVGGTTPVFTISGVEHCREAHREELMIDAQTEQPGNFSRYLQYACREITDTDAMTGDGAAVMNVQAKASFLVRQVLNALVKPFKADEIIEEIIAIEQLNLYFYPVYTFEYLWSAKDKRAVLEFDGFTGEVRKGCKLSEKLLQTFTYDEIFDFAKEVAAFMPGGALAMMAGRKAYQIVKKT